MIKKNMVRLQQEGELERERKTDHREWHCLLERSQPGGDSVWGEKSWGGSGEEEGCQASLLES